jgi:hypothetical protein
MLNGITIFTKISTPLKVDSGISPVMTYEIIYGDVPKSGRWNQKADSLVCILNGSHLAQRDLMEGENIDKGLAYQLELAFGSVTRSDQYYKDHAMIGHLKIFVLRVCRRPSNAAGNRVVRFQSFGLLANRNDKPRLPIVNNSSIGNSSTELGRKVVTLVLAFIYRLNLSFATEYIGKDHHANTVKAASPSQPSNALT